MTSHNGFLISAFESSFLCFEGYYLDFLHISKLAGTTIFQPRVSRNHDNKCMALDIFVIEMCHCAVVIDVKSSFGH